MLCLHDQWNIALTQCQAMLVAPHHLLLWRFGARSQWFTVLHGTLKIAEVVVSIHTISHIIDIVASNVDMLHIMSSKCFIN